MKFVKILQAVVIAATTTVSGQEVAYTEIIQNQERINTNKIVVSGRVYMSTPFDTIPLRATGEIKGTNITVTANSDGYFHFHTDPTLKKKDKIKLICRLPGKKPIKGTLKAPFLARYYVNFDFNPEG